MGIISSFLIINNSTTQLSICLDVVKEEKSRERQSLAHPELDFNSPLEEFTVFFAREITLNVSELVHPSTWLLSFLNWQEMLPVTTRRPVSFLVTCDWPSA